MGAVDVGNEAAFVRSIFSRLQELLGENRLISSEDFLWLPTTGLAIHDQKPDLLVLHPAFYTRKESLRPYVCGVPSSQKFFGEMKLIDVKLRDPNTAFGEHIIHLNHLYDNVTKNSGAFVSTRGAVANSSGIILVECLMRTPIWVMSVKWTDTGGAKAFANFFKGSCKTLEETIGFILDEVCKQLNVKIVESKPNEPCFLGAGTMGHVFKVHDDDEEYALKIVLGESNARMLRKEYMIIREICCLTPPADQITVIADNYAEVKALEAIIGAGFLMSPVGIPVDRSNLSHFKLGLKTLLKLHKLQKYHGDARAANFLLWKNQVILCDLREVGQFVTGNLFDFQNDIATFLQSFEILIDTEIKTWVEQYDPSKENVEEIINYISDHGRRS
jgi:hypothetical protein